MLVLTSDVVTHLCEHVRFDTTWRDAVDGDAALAKVGGKGLDHADDGHLARVVEGVVLDAQQPSGDRAHEDEPAVVLQVLPRRLTDEELRARVQVEDVVVDLLGDLLGLVPRLGAAVAHDNVDLAKVLLALLEQAVDLGDLGHVGLDADGLGARAALLDRFAYFVGGGFRGRVVDDDAAAALAELDGASSSDAAA